MRALVMREHGGLDVLRLAPAFQDPHAGRGEVVLRVLACSVAAP